LGDGGFRRRDVGPGIGYWDQSALDVPFELVSTSEAAATEWLNGFTLRSEVSFDQKNAVAVGAVVDEMRPPDSFLLVQMVEHSHLRDCAIPGI